MASNTIALLLLLFSFFFFFFFTPCLSDTPPSAPVTPMIACNFTPDPNFCKSVLPPQGTQTMYTCCCFSLAKSLLTTQKFLNLINNYLARCSTLSLTAVQALEDCRFLSQLYIDFLTSAGVALNSTNNMLDSTNNMLDFLTSAGVAFSTAGTGACPVVGQGFVARNMTFQNTAGAIKHQAVAVRNGANLSTFYSCSFEGYQDTLYTHSMRQFYRECDIYGTVDYIFGNAAVVFQKCTIYSRLPMQGQSNTITAQGRTDPNQNTGMVIQDCDIVAAPDLASDSGSTITYLGRPWQNFSRTVIMESFMDSLIDPRGWMPWDGDFALTTLYYAEFNNNGPGSDTSHRVTWPGFHVINSTDASNFTVGNFILGDNWLPETGVPYFSGLL